MSAIAATPDQAAVTTPPVNSSADSALDEYYAELEARGEDVNVPDVPTATSTTTAPAGPTTDAAAAVTSTDADAAATALAATPAPSTATAAAPTWRDEIDANPNLPKHLQGKTRGEVYDANVGAEWRAMEAGRKKNDAERELLVTKAMLTTLRDTAPKPVAPPPPAPVPGYTTFGLPDAESAFGAVPQIVEQLPGYIEKRANEIANARVAPLEKTVNDLRDEAVINAAEAARFTARDHLKVDAGVYEGLTPFLKTYLRVNGLDPRFTQNWEAAYLDLKSRVAPLIPQTATIPPSGPPVGGATSTSAAPVAPQRAISTGDKKADGMIARQLVEFFGHTRGTKEFDAAFKKNVDAYKFERRNGADA